MRDLLQALHKAADAFPELLFVRLEQPEDTITFFIKKKKRDILQTEEGYSYGRFRTHSKRRLIQKVINDIANHLPEVRKLKETIRLESAQ